MIKHTNKNRSLQSSQNTQWVSTALWGKWYTRKRDTGLSEILIQVLAVPMIWGSPLGEWTRLLILNLFGLNS